MNPRQSLLLGLWFIDVRHISKREQVFEPVCMSGASLHIHGLQSHQVRSDDSTRGNSSWLQWASGGHPGKSAALERTVFGRGSTNETAGNLPAAALWKNSCNQIGRQNIRFMRTSSSSISMLVIPMPIYNEAVGNEDVQVDISRQTSVGRAIC